MPQNKKGLLENQQLVAVENDLKTMAVKGARKIAKDREIDPEGGRGPTWTVESVEKQRGKVFFL